MPIIKFNATVEVEQHIEILIPAYTMQDIINGLNGGSLTTDAFDNEGFIMNRDSECVARVKRVFFHKDLYSDFKIA